MSVSVRWPSCTDNQAPAVDTSAEFFWPYRLANCFFPADFRLVEFFTADFRRIQNSADFRLMHSITEPVLQQQLGDCSKSKQVGIHCSDQSSKTRNSLVTFARQCKRFIDNKALLSRGEPRNAAANLYIRIQFCNKSIMERLCTLNAATLLTWTHLAPNPAQNTLNYAQRSFKVTHFGIAEKPTRSCVLYDNVRFRVGNFQGKV